MAIAFSSIPANQLVPLFYAEVTSAQEPWAASLQLCLIGHANNGAGFGEGTAVLDQLYLVTRTDATTLFGRGSMLEWMYQKARYNAPAVEIWCIAIPESPGAVRATATITITSASSQTRKGNALWYIAGRGVRINIPAPGMTTLQIADLLVYAINRMSLPCKAARLVSGSAAITLTCRWAGATGNELLISFAGPSGRYESNNPAVVLARTISSVTQFTGGIGEAAPAATFAAIGDKPLDVFVFPITSAGNLDACQDFMDGSAGRWSPFKQLYGHMVTAIRGSFSSLVSFGSLRNDPHMSILAIWKSIFPTWEWASALAAVMITHWANPPEASRPLQTLELRGIAVGSDDDQWFDSTERQILLENGMSTFTVDRDGTARIERVRTTRKYNLYGDPDPSWADAVTMFQAMYFVRQMRSAITGAFPRAALTTQDSGIPGFASASQIRMVINHEYRRMEKLGLVENSELFTQYLIVERDEVDRNRVNCLMRPDMVNQLRVVAVLVETHLELIAGDPGLEVASTDDTAAPEA